MIPIIHADNGRAPNGAWRSRCGLESLRMGVTKNIDNVTCDKCKAKKKKT